MTELPQLSSPASIDQYRLLTLLSVMIGSSQLLQRKLSRDKQVTVEEMHAALDRIQRSGWEAARVARILYPELPGAAEELGGADEVTDNGK